jgi:DNA-binding transcriptional ArsR family regulator
MADARSQPHSMLTEEGWIPEPGVEEMLEKIALSELDLLGELTHPTRSQVLRALKQPRTVAELAEVLDVPVTRLYHHVNRLESLGFIRVVATRRVGAATERRYQVVAKSWQVAPELFEASDRRELAAALGSLFDVSKMAFQREVESGGFAGVDDLSEHGFLSRGYLYLSDGRRRELLERLTEVVREFTSDVDEDDPAANRMELFIAAFPETA